MAFDKDMFWGCATAAYQIEGAKNIDGKGDSIWDVFTSKQGTIARGENGDVACNHYHRMEEDVALMQSLGLNSYRFSISWPRVLPNGTGSVNEKGLDFYDRLTDELLRKEIVPFATLFHWDYPQELFHKGGWLNNDSPHWFAEYAQVIGKRLGDRIQNFMTWNEPQCFVGLGHLLGWHAPGLKLSLKECVRVGHNVLRAHGLGVKALRNTSKSETKIFCAPICELKSPYNNEASNVEIARTETFVPRMDMQPLWNTGWWLDPVFFGKYPDCELTKLLPDGFERDMDEIKEPCDYIGFNIYQSAKVSCDDGKARYIEPVQGYPSTHLKWRVDPDSIYWAGKFMFERYKKPIIVTENGCAYSDIISLDGKVHDSQRIDFIARYLKRLKDLTNEGVDVAGYFYWTLMDNFEWAEGYDPRFGLIFTDYANDNERIIKDSGHYFSDIIKSNGESL